MTAAATDGVVSPMSRVSNGVCDSEDTETRPTAEHHGRSVVSVNPLKDTDADWLHFVIQV